MNKFPPTRNLLIAALPEVERAALLRGARQVSLRGGQVVYEQDTPLDGVYFPLAGAISVLTVMEDGNSIEAAIVGREGVLGFPIGLGTEVSPWRSVVQLPGEAIVVRREAFRARLAAGGTLAPLLTHMAGVLINLAAQSGACNHFHTVGQRCARWLLLMRARAEGDTFAVTQQFLSDMIGARRPSISLAVQELRDAGAISYTRGVVTVVDRTVLEREVCECFGRVQQQYDAMARMLGERGALESIG